MNSESLTKLDYVDSLRGFAILLVILVHSSQFPGCSSNLAVFGARGVQLFFVVSAFTLLRSMASRSAREKSSVRNFFIRRFFRIAPPFYITAAISLVCDGLSPRYFAPSGLQIWAIPATFLFVNGWNPNTINSIVPGGWSIAIEMTFYAILPFLFYSLRSLKRAAVCWLITVAIACAMSPVSYWLSGATCPAYLASTFDFLWFPGQLPVFISGCMLYYALRYQVKVSHFLVILSGQIFLIFFLIRVCRHFRFDSHLETHKDILLSGIFASLFAFTLAKLNIPILVNRVTKHIGKVSFSGYLSHFWVLRVLLPSANLLSIIPQEFRLLTVFLIVSVCTILFSSITYALIEIPSQNVGKSLIMRLDQLSEA